ncbi:MAG: beta-lactamase family protein, partial [Actinobacteria bacterium]|nr:beta-lactamase family protein [Actinomycetota bacterium]
MGIEKGDSGDDRAAAGGAMLTGCGGDSTRSGKDSASSPAPVEETSNLSATDAAFIKDTVNKAMAGGKIPGVTVSITAPDKTFLWSYGVADKTTGRKLSPGDHFRIGSTTKTFTATAVLQLVDEKKIGLDDTLETFVPGVPNGATVTMRHLLNMRSGLPTYSDAEFLAAYQADPLMPSWTHTDVVAFLQRTPVSFAPGEQFDYSNSNYLLLGMILEKVTGQSAEQVISERVIRKLELGQTSVPTPPTYSAMPEPF